MSAWREENERVEQQGTPLRLGNRSRTEARGITPRAFVRDMSELHVERQFSPLRDFGGWGIRTGRNGTCLNQRGSRGVAFEFRGRRYIIGSDYPEALLSAMHTVGVPRR